MKKKIGTFTVSLTLICLGILLILSNFYDFKVFTALSFLFGVALIIFGCEFIYYSSKKDSEIKVSSGSVVTLIFLGVFSFVAMSVTQIFGGFYNLAFTNNEDGDMIFTLGETTSHVITQTITDPIKDITIINKHGDITVKGQDREDIDIEIVIRETNRSKITDEILESLKTNLTNDYYSISHSSNGNLSIRTIDSFNSGGWSSYYYSIDYTLYVPKEMAFDLENEHGNIEMTDIDKGGKITNSHGYIQVVNLQGDLSAKNAHGKVELVNIIGNIDTETTHNKIYIDDIKGNMIIKNSHGNIYANNIEGTLDFNTKHTGIYLTNAPQPIKVIGSHHEMSFTDIKNLDLNTEHAKIKIINTVELVENLLLRTTHGGVEAQLVPEQKGRFLLKSEYGNINTDFDLSLARVDDDNFKKVDQKIGDSDANIKIIVSHGSINLLN